MQSPLKVLLGAAVLSVASLAPLAAHAQFEKIEDAVKYRQSAFSLMGTHFGHVGDVVKGKRPYDQNTVAKDLQIVQMLSHLPFDAFPAKSNIKGSKAKPVIWKEQEKFQKAAKTSQEAIDKLVVANQSGDLGVLKTAFGTAGQSCKACHDDFRRK